MILLIASSLNCQEFEQLIAEEYSTKHMVIVRLVFGYLLYTILNINIDFICPNEDINNNFNSFIKQTIR